MQEKIRVLILEDNPTDVELMKLQMRKAGFNFTLESCPDKRAFLKTLGTFTPDILLADYALPDFDGMEALRIARKKFPELPVVIVSGAIGEETAIEALKAGATDYVLKQRLGRLGPVIGRAILEAKQLRERKRAEEEVRHTSEELRARNEELMRFNRAMVDRELRVIELKKEVNELCRRLGKAPAYPLDFEVK